MPIANGVIDTQVTTTTHHLDTASAAAVANPIPGIPAKAIIATGGGATTNIEAHMKVNGTTPGTAAIITAPVAVMSTPILNDSGADWVLRAAASTLEMAITLPAFLLKAESERLG